MTTALDTNVLLDVLADSPHREASISALEQASLDGGLVISEIVYAELAPGLRKRERLDEALAEMGITVVGLGRKAAFEAGAIFGGYRRSGGSRTHILADFLIAAHAVEHADRLLTRDRGFYRDCFPNLTLMQP